uniref:Uncharacterized protein n=1 Tax=Octopus bimaculoides TaxID=37653 RepID=A0A0L8FRH4_OCTBM
MCVKTRDIDSRQNPHFVLFSPSSFLFCFSLLFAILPLLYSSSSFSSLFIPSFFLLYFSPPFPSLFFLSFPFSIHPLLISPPYSLQHSSSFSFKLILLFSDFSKSAFVSRNQ